MLINFFLKLVKLVRQVNHNDNEPYKGWYELTGVVPEALHVTIRFSKWNLPFPNASKLSCALVIAIT